MDKFITEDAVTQFRSADFDEILLLNPEKSDAVVLKASKQIGKLFAPTAKAAKTPVRRLYVIVQDVYDLAVQERIKTALGA